MKLEIRVLKCIIAFAGWPGGAESDSRYGAAGDGQEVVVTGELISPLIHVVLPHVVVLHRRVSATGWRAVPVGGARVQSNDMHVVRKSMPPQPRLHTPTKAARDGISREVERVRTRRGLVGTRTEPSQ